MGNTYPKTYVEERIQIRINKLLSNVRKAEEALEAVTPAYAKYVTRWAEQRESELDSAVTKARRGLKKLVQGDSLSSQELDKALSAAAFSFSISDTPGQAWGKNAPEYNAYTDAKSKLHDAKRAEREVDNLEHALVYLKGTPATEFSLTGLKQLGLLDVIKFNLDRDEK